MKKIVVLIPILLLFSAVVRAQDNSSEISNHSATIDSLIDLSSRQWITDSLTVLSWSDSLKLNINKKFTTDSLGLKHKIDSLQGLNLSTDKYTHKLDSIAGKKDQLVGEVNSKQGELLSKTKGRIDQWKQTIKSKVGLDSLSMSSGIKVSDPAVPNMSGINGTGNLPSANLAGLDIPEIPSLNVNDFQDLNLSTDLSQINQQLSFNELDGLKEIQDKIGNVSEGISNITSFTKDTDKAIESTISKVDEVKAVKEQLNVVDGVQQNEFMERANQLKDPNAMKEEVQQQAMKQAVNHFAGKEEVLKQAMEKMAKYKQKYSSLNSLSDIPKRKPNEMRGKPFVERLLPGIAFQIQRKNDLLVDFNPYVGYRLTGRLTSGLGWNHRVAFVEWNRFNSQNRIFGPRVYGEFKLWKGFSPRAEIEVMNTYVPPLFRTSGDIGQREWVWSAMIGLKKEYRFLKNVKGTAFVMFNLFDPHHKSPYVDIVNTRFGFEFPIKKKVKKEDKQDKS